MKYTHDSGIRFGLVYVERKGSDGTQEYVVWRFIRQAEMRGVKLRQKEVSKGERTCFAWPGSQSSREGGVHLPADDAGACR